MVSVESAGFTDVGKKRKANQDALFMDDRLGLYVVSDGMGGHQAGEVASRMVVDSIRDVMTGQPDDRYTDADRDPSLSDPANLLLHAIETANRKVFSAAAGNPSQKGMGATVSAVLLSNEAIIAANVGDSPIYLVHKGHLERLSVPHTLMAEHAALDPEGKIPFDSKLGHLLTQAIGTQGTVLVDTCEIQRFPGDILILCSDGLSNKVTTDEIRHRVQTESAIEACRQLLGLANHRGGEDNITVMVVKITPNRSMFEKIINRFRRLFRRK